MNKKRSFILDSIFNKIDENFKTELRNTQRKTAIISAILFAIFYYYIFLPPLNIRSQETWFYFGVIIGIIAIIGGKSFKYYRYIRYLFIGMIALFLLLNIFGATIFQSKNYSDIIEITESNFESDIEQLPVDKIPTLDKDSSIRLGSRKMGELIDLVSQFDIDESTYTQINYQDHPVRVTPLMYNGFIKYLFNMSDGIPGYLMVDIVNGNSDLVQLENKIKISKQDYFFRDVMRYARIRYPFDIFKFANFEIDEEGIPYWIIPTYAPKVGFFNAQDVNGAIIINASSGEHIKYSLEEIPQWIDRLFEADDIIRQLDWNGLYKGGFINSLFAQKNVLQTTEGYNYLALDDDVYLYTGFTSVAADESNVGFILSNLRTKETKFYPISSAEEFSAMSSAEGAVQEKGYVATFPLLLNIDGKPTYFLSLKDNAGLIKLYAFIDAQNYQNVAVGSTVAQALQNHRGGELGDINEQANPQEQSEILEANGNITDIKEVVINGTSYYYILIDSSDEIFVASINISNRLPFLTNESIDFKYQETNGTNNIIEIEIK